MSTIATIKILAWDSNSGHPARTSEMRESIDHTTIIRMVKQ